jgi:hypothetical protein
MSGVSLSVMSIKKINKDVFEKESYSLERQVTFDNWGNEVKELGLPKTELTNRFKLSEYIHYKAKMSTETIKEPIYIYENGFFECTNGYQKIKTFDLLINEDSNILYTFAPKQVVETFIKRLRKEGCMVCSDLPFDFSKLGELENLDSAWGVWEDSKGTIKRIAKFGKGIESEIEDYGSITTFYIDYNYKGNPIQLILGLDGRISTQRDLKQKDIFNIYNDISGTLLKR